MMLYDLLIGPFVEFEFMRRALVGTLALSLSAAPVGVFLLLRRMSLTGDCMAHAILPGAAIGYLFAGLSLTAMTIGGIVAVLHDMDTVTRHFPETMLLARELIAWGRTPDVCTPTNLLAARHMVEAFDASANACERGAA